MATVNQDRTASKSAPALDWPSWTDADVWELNEDHGPSDEDRRAAARLFGDAWDSEPGSDDLPDEFGAEYASWLDNLEGRCDDDRALTALEAGFVPLDRSPGRSPLISKATADFIARTSLVGHAAAFASQCHQDQTGEALDADEATCRASEMITGS